MTRLDPALLPCGCRLLPFTGAYCAEAQRLAAACDGGEGERGV